jgi:HK97 family phage major capsid protein
MSVSTRVVGELEQLFARRGELRATIENHLETVKLSGGNGLDPKTKAMRSEWDQLQARIKQQADEVKRAGVLQLGQQSRGGHRRAGERATHTGGQLSPLAFPDEELRRLQTSAMRGEHARIEARDFSTADALLPASLQPIVVAAQHENRLLDRLPALSIDQPSTVFIRHVSTTGVPAVTAEGQPKAEVTLNTDSLTATAKKLAAHTAVSYELISDFTQFHSYVNVELFRQVVDLENAELLLGGFPGITGSGSTEAEPAGPEGIVGFYATPGILTHDASTDTGTNVTALDSIEIAINELRIGPALATPDLLILNPSTWSAMRRVKNTLGQFLVAPDPTRDVASSLWDVDVLVTTQNPAGMGLLISTSEFGYVAVREGLSLRLGWSGEDFTNNLLRSVAEERLTLAVTRPPAVCAITNLPTGS